jgi:hypothetical protein
MANVTFAGPVLSKAGFGFVSGGSSVAGTTEASKHLSVDANLEMDGLGVLKVADKLITTAQVLALNATPITVIAAPGSGKTIQFEGAYVMLDFATTGYVAGAGEDLVFRYTNGSGKIVSTAVDGTILAAVADAIQFVGPAYADPSVTAETANAALVAHIVVGEIVTGDSPLKIRVFYRVVRTAALEAIA